MAVSFFFSSLSIYLYDSYARPKVKVVDVVRIMNLKLKEYRKLDPGEAQVRMEVFLKKLNEELRKEKGIVLIKNAVVGGDSYEDITERILEEVD